LINPTTGYAHSPSETGVDFHGMAGGKTPSGLLRIGKDIREDGSASIKNEAGSAPAIFYNSIFPPPCSGYFPSVCHLGKGLMGVGRGVVMTYHRL